MIDESGPAAASVPLAIVGIGCLFPRAGDARAYWLNVKNGVDAIGNVPPSHWDPADFVDADPKAADRTYASRGGFLDPVDFRPLDFGIAPNDLEATDTSQLLGLVAAKQALLDAGYGPDRDFDRNRVSVILGVTGTLELVIPLGARLGHPRWRKALKNAGVPDEQAERIVCEIADSYVGWQENSFPGLLGNVVAGRIANRLDLGGTNCVVDAACASSLSAVHLAGLELAAGRCDVAVTGGVDTFNDIFMYMCFSKTPALSPTGDARPFDAGGDGTIIGEGLGIIVLKRLADAQRDGDRVYAVIRGVGSSSDGRGNAIYAPSSAGQSKALRNAYRHSGIAPDTIELVEAHGTGTRVGDAAEVAALTEVFRESKPEGTWCALGSVKSQIGHTKAAAGAAGLIKAALALHHKVLPPTIKVRAPIESLQSGSSPLYVNAEQRPWVAKPDHPRRAAVSAFGFGGSNFHCVLEEHGPEKTELDWGGDVEIIALSAASAAELVRELDGWRAPREWNQVRHDAGLSRQRFSSQQPVRLLIVANRDSTDVPKLVGTVLAKLEGEPAARSWRLPEGAYFGSGPAEGRLAVLFPGQGSQYVGMLRDLACLFPEMSDVLVQANRVFARMIDDGSNDRLSDLIYPPHAFTMDEKERQERRLRDTEVAQPAIGAVSLGALKVFERFGLQPDAYAGHSYGELPALCAAGCFDEEALHTMSRLRGHLMASYHGGDAGCMLAVHAPLTTIEAVLREESLDLVIANRNAPEQSVLSGRQAEIDRAAACLGARHLRHTHLSVAAAFHSPLVASARQPFRDALEGLTFQSARQPVFANTSGREYPREPEAIREVLAGQLACPVDFVREVACMAQGGARTFLEVGPGSTLTRLTAAILSAPENAAHAAGWDAFALDASSGKRSGQLDLAHALAHLAARGHKIDLTPWQVTGAPERNPERVKPGLSVPICGANYVAPKTNKALEGPHEAHAPLGGSPARAPDRSPPAKPRPEPLVTRSEHAPVIATGFKPRPAQAANPEAIAQALQITQQSLAAFQRLQEQTAQLHKQFLDNQSAAQHTLQMLVEQQHALLLGTDATARPRRAPLPIEVPPPAALPATTTPVSPLRNGDAYALREQQVAPVIEAIPVAFDPGPILMEVIAAKTGYPAEMLAPEMALDADLGIDSIKRVEIFSAIQERLPSAPVVKPEHLGSLHTLRDVIEFLSKAGEAPAAESETRQRKTAIEQSAPILEPSQISDVFFAVVAEKTGYPPEMLGVEMALDADLGIDSIKRVEIFSALQERLPDAPVVKPENLGTLHTIADIVAFLSGTTKPRPAATPVVVKTQPAAKTVTVERSVLHAAPVASDLSESRVRLARGANVIIVGEPSPLTTGLIQSVEADGQIARLIGWNGSPDSAELAAVAGLILVAPATTTFDDLPLRAVRWMRCVSAALRQSAAQEGAVAATVTSLGGSFGVEGLDASIDPGNGALAGLAKTARHEWPDVACRAIDVDSYDVVGLATRVWEAIVQAGAVEVGISANATVSLELRAEAPRDSAPALTASDVVLITGGARGVTAAAALAISERFRPTIILLGRTSIAEPEAEALRGCSAEGEIKTFLAKHLRPPASPKEIESACRDVIARREALDNIARMKAAGAKVYYYRVDVAQPDDVARGLREIRSKVGPVTCLIHGAGVLADRRIEDLTDEQFQRVFATKVGGLESILRALRDDPLKAMVLFSSSTARFGRTGQAAYAAANEALNKIAQQQHRLRPNCRVVALNWGPWDGGMVTPALRKLFESEGVGVIPLNEGADILVRELAAPRDDVEVIVIARPSNTAPAERTAAAAPAPMHVVFEQEVTLRDYPILRAHVIDGKPVVPLALQLEWLAHAALHGNPGLAFHGVNDLRVLAGVRLDEAQPMALQFLAGPPERRDGVFLVATELRGRRGARDIVHARAQVVLAPKLPAAPVVEPTPSLDPYPHPVADIYRHIVFHGPDLAGIERVEGVHETAIVGMSRTAPVPSVWLREPLRRAWIADPQAIDSAFQLMIVWSVAQNGAGCLPSFVGRYRQYRRSFPAGPIRIVVRVKNTGGSVARADIDFLDASGSLIACLQDHESVIDANLNRAFRSNRIPETAGAERGDQR